MLRRLYFASRLYFGLRYSWRLAWQLAAPSPQAGRAKPAPTGDCRRDVRGVRGLRIVHIART